MKMSRDIDLEREVEWRLQTMNRVLEEATSSSGMTSALLDEHGISRTQRGIYRAKTETGGIAGCQQGITRTLLHTGRVYEDEISEDWMIYRYPKTGQTTHDEGEIEATKAALRFRVPVFVVTRPGGKKAPPVLQWGMVEDADDDLGCFKVRLGDNVLNEEPVSASVDDNVVLLDRRERRVSKSSRARRDPAFKFDVLKLHGARCAFCDVRVPELLDAAHIIPVHRGGSDSRRNGIILCKLHHEVFDRDMVRIQPKSHQLHVTDANWSFAELKLKHQQLHFSGVSEEALSWRWTMKRLGASQ
jgi:putative restriction endonuclease